MECIIVNLFNIPANLYSHPNYPYHNHILKIAESFDDVNHREAASFHDLGKLSDEFQRYISGLSKKKTTHALESALIYMFSQDGDITPSNFAIFLAIYRHHSKLPNVTDLIEDVLSDEDYLEDHYLGLTKKIKKILKLLGNQKEFDLEEICDLFGEDDFLESYSLKGLENYFKIKEVFSRLIFADKYEAIFKESFEEASTIDAQGYIDRLLKLISSKDNLLSKIRNQAREEVVDNFYQNKQKRIHIIEAPTGIGKTFMALHLGLEIIKSKKRKRLIAALPMTSIIDQTFEEYSKIIDEKDLLKFHHLTYSKQYRDDEEKQYKQKNDYITTSWSRDNVIITTFNQIFDCFYSNKNRDLVKFWTLRNSVIILDEIQAIPRVLLQDFSKTISFLAKEFNIDFILMSATIPAIKHFLDQDITSELLDLKYFSMPFNNRYQLQLDLNINHIDLFSDAIKKSIVTKNSLLAVVNTKKTALKLYDLLIGDFGEELFLLSANFIPLHRKEIIKKISSRLKSNQKTILISTQVIEAGVDLDFDIGFREFAPFSSVIQTAGRVNREGKKHLSPVIVTKSVGGSPYHQKDLSYEDMASLLTEKIESKDLLPYLNQYFEIVINKTTQNTLLIEDMKELNFETVIHTFHQHFMTKLPYIGSVFIEVEEGLYDSLKDRRERILQQNSSSSMTLEQKMEQKILLKELYKEVSKYIINVPEKEISHFLPIWEGSDIYCCPYSHVEDESNYSFVKGWISEEENMIW